MQVRYRLRTRSEMPSSSKPEPGGSGSGSWTALVVEPEKKVEAGTPGSSRGSGFLDKRRARSFRGFVSAKYRGEGKGKGNFLSPEPSAADADAPSSSTSASSSLTPRGLIKTMSVRVKKRNQEAHKHDLEYHDPPPRSRTPPPSLKFSIQK